MYRTEEILNRPTNEQGNGSNSTEQTGAERLNTIIDDLKKQNQQTGAERLNAIINSLKNQNKPKQQSQFQDAPVFSKLKEQQQKQNSWESRGWDYEKDEIAGEVQKVNDEYINQYIQNIQNYAKSAPDAYKNASYGDMNVFLEQHQHETYELQKQGDAIKKYLESNPNAYAENRQSLMDFLTSNNEAVSAYRNMLNNAEAGNSLYIPTTAEERQDKYESNQKKIDELTYNGLLEDFFLSDEDKAKVDRLRKENKDYELGQGGYATTKKADEYSKVMQNEDFAKVSAERGQIPTKEDIAMFDAMNDSRTWYYDENGIPRDSFGNELATDASGNLYNPKAQQSPVTDRLGLYLSATKDENKDYMATLSSNTWAGVINDALDGSWDSLTKDDISVYYYLLNTEGQASADKYLDDMKLELNRRETMSDQQRWTEKYNNSNWLQKIGMNAETLPAKFLSGTAGFVDNTVKALTGNEINPYDAVHSGTYFTNTVRGETAKELDKTGFEIPGVNFTLGDIYQTGMSRLDSALATAIFGGGGTVFLGMQAAEQEALKLYEKGANETQITLGAFAAGLAETIFEYASFGELQNLKNASKGEIEGWAKRALKNAWSQGMDEAREETLTGLTNLVTNALIMGKDSDLAEMYKENKDEAFGLFKDLLQQTAHDAFGGFIGGAGAGITQTAGQYLQNYNQIRNAKKFGNTQKTQQAQQQSAPEVQVPTAESTGAQLQNIKEMAKAKLEALGETKGAEAIAEAIAKQVSGEKLTTTEELLINDSHNSRQVLQDMSEIAQKQAQPVDTQAQTSYDNKNTNGGIDVNEQSGDQLHSAVGEGVRTVRYGEAANRTVQGERGLGQGDLRVPGELLLSKTADEALQKAGKPNVQMTESTNDPDAFSKALEEARTTDVKNGWCVSPKSAEEASAPGMRTYMAENGAAGFAITKDGDIEAVFSNKQKGAPKGIADSLMLRAISAGGNRLDCYGERLATMYSGYGFIPVARVEFNEEFANEGWDESKGRPYVYIMVHNGDSADTVARKLGTYQLVTKEQLDALPTYGKEDYEAAMEYRNGLLNQRNAEKNATEAGRDSALPETAVGAAPAGFDQLSSAMYKYGNIPEGENPARIVDLPVSMDGKSQVSRTARTVAEAKATTDEFAELIGKKVAKGGLSYIPIKNSETTQKAVEYIQRVGWDAALEGWSKDVHAGKTGADMSAIGALLLNNAANAGDRNTWLNVLHDYQIMGTYTAQGLQALRILKQLEPSDKLYMLKRSARQLVEDMHLDAEITISEELQQEYDNAKTDEERDKVLKKIQKDIASQIPSTALDKWTALRYVNMLGNLRTQIRNVAGNAGMKLVSSAKNAVAVGIENLAYKASGGKLERTKSLTVSKAQMNAGKADFDNVKFAVLNGGKYADSGAQTADLMQGIQDQRTIFKSDNKILNAAMKPMEGYRKVTNWAMEAGDLLFSKPAYARALAGYLKANGITGSDYAGVDTALMDDARLYAIKEAQEQTFRDTNWLSGWISKVGRRKDTPKAVKAISEGIMPFRKTPANVLVRAEEYSPLGIINSVYYSIKAAKKGSDITGAQVINSWAKTITGTGIFGLGMLLYNLGMLSTGDDEDEKKESFDSMNGWQNYALILPDGTNLTIDFLTPEAMPLLMGAELMKMMQEGGISAKDIEKALTSIADPMIQMSMLQGVNDTLDNIQYAEDNLGQLLINASVSYLTQGLTNTLAGQIERSFEDSRMQTFVDKDSDLPSWLQRTLGKASAKIPGWDYHQVPYINAWGEEEKNPGLLANLAYNTLSPSYIEMGQNTPLTRELERLNKAVPDANTYPSVPDKTISYTDSDGKKHTDYVLTPEDWTSLAKKQGQEQRQLVESLIQSDMYKNLPDEYKAEAIKRAYTYAKEKARLEVIKDYTVSNANAWTQRTDDPVNDILMKAATDSIVDGLTPQSGYESVRTVQKVEAITAADDLLTAQEQADALRDVLSDGFAERYDKVIAMGYDNDDFAKVYSIYTQDQDSKDIDKDDALKMIMRELNITKSQARKLYDAYTAPKDKSK